jgi:hypothetical protein
MRLCKKQDINKYKYVNPYQVFLHLVKGHGLSTNEKKRLYAKFKSYFLSKIKSVNEKNKKKALYKLLCKQLKIGELPCQIKTISKINIHSITSSKISRLDCKIEKCIIDFFQKILNVKFDTEKNACKMLASYLLHKGLSVNKQKEYNFYKLMCNGASGLVFLGKIIHYNEKTKYIHDVVIKTQLESKDYTNFCISKYLHICTNDPKSTKNEIDTHKKLLKIKFQSFRIPKLFSELSTVNLDRFTVQSYLMEKINVKEFKSPSQERENILRKLSLTPMILHELHQHGYIHGDCHFNNILYDQDKKHYDVPILIDFGRTRMFSQILRKHPLLIKFKDYKKRLIVGDYFVALYRVLSIESSKYFNVYVANLKKLSVDFLEFGYFFDKMYTKQQFLDRMIIWKNFWSKDLLFPGTGVGFSNIVL